MYRSPTILVVESDPEERLLLRRALSEARFDGISRFVQSVEEMYEYLERRGRYAYPADAPFPGLLLLDLRVIRENVSGLVETLRENATTRRVPIVVLSPPISEEDCRRCYDAGANAVVEKPLGYDDFRARIFSILSFWFDVVALPPPL